MSRPNWMPHSCSAPGRKRSDLNGIAISTVQPPSKRPVRTSQTGFQSRFGSPSSVICRSLKPPMGLTPEGEAVPAVVEGVEHDDESVVVDELKRVSLHLVGDPLRLGNRLVDAGRHVDRLIVEEDPGVGRFRGRSPLVGGLLDEVAERLHAVVDRLVEHAVDPPGPLEAHGADRRPAAGVAVDGGRRRRGGWTIDLDACRRGLRRRRQWQDPEHERGRESRCATGGGLPVELVAATCGGVYPVDSDNWRSRSRFRSGTGA